MFTDIVETIKSYESKGDFTYASISDEDILLSEKKLSLKIPGQYVWFLKTYGHGGLDGVEVMGVGRNGKLVFMEETETYRTYGLPTSLIVIENCDEWVYCIDSITGKVKMWSMGDDKADDAYETFIEYFSDRMNDAIENM